MSRTLEWQLEQLTPGSEVLVKDATGHVVARGVLRNDRQSLLGPNGEYIPLMGHPDWSIAVLRAKKK